MASFYVYRCKGQLLFLKEDNGGKNFLSVTGGKYKSAGTIDLGDGNILKNNTNIKLAADNKFTAVYVMTGTAPTDELEGMEFFEEIMMPFGPGRIAAMATARWKTKNNNYLDAIFSTKYMFDSNNRLEQPQVRRIDATPTLRGGDWRRGDGCTFGCTYTGYVTSMTRSDNLRTPYMT